MRLICSAILAVWSATSGANPIVFEQVNVVQIDSGTILQDQYVVVEGGKITRIDGAAPATIETATRLDGNGAFLIPGLAEMHAHIPATSREQYLEDVLFLYLSQGVTTVRSMLGEPGHLALRESAASGDLDSPRIIASAPSLNGNSVSSPEAAEAMVRSAHAAGYDHLKIHPGLTKAEFDAIATTANALGIKYVGHVDASYGARHAMNAGMSGIDHLDGFLESLLPDDAEPTPGFFGINVIDQVDPSKIDSFAEFVANSKTWVVPTEALMVTRAGPLSFDALMERPESRFVDQQTRSQWQRAKAVFDDAPLEQRKSFLALRSQLIHALNKADANLLLGSDAPQVFNVPGYSTHHELAIYVDAGLSPRDALVTGTINVARYLDRNDMGKVEKGFIADLVLIGCNPLKDIQCTKQVQGVMQSGKWYDKSTIEKRLDEIAARVD